MHACRLGANIKAQFEDPSNDKVDTTPKVAVTKMCSVLSNKHDWEPVFCRCWLLVHCTLNVVRLTSRSLLLAAKFNDIVKGALMHLYKLMVDLPRNARSNLCFCAVFWFYMLGPVFF